MSTIIMKPEDLRQIADFLYELNEFGFDRFGFSCPQKLSQFAFMYFNNKMRVSNVYNVLLALNVAVYNNEWNIDKQVDVAAEKYNMPEEKDGYKSIIQSRVADCNGEYIQKWHYEMANLLGAYLYQVDCCQTYVQEKPRAMFYILQELKNILNEFIVSNYHDPMELGTMGCRSLPGTDVVAKSKEVPMADITVENILCKLCDESNIIIQNSSYEELARYDGRESIDAKYNTKKVLSMHVEMIEQLHRPGSFVPALVVEIDN